MSAAWRSCPDVVRRMAAAGHEVVIEAGAGEAAGVADAAYADAGATVADADAAWSADVVAKVAAPSEAETARLGADSVLIGFLGPLTNGPGVKAIAASGATSFAMEAIPRISRAQSMDALSSQATVSGYRAVLIGAQELGRFFPMLMTAAGTVPPAQVLVLGAGVAGLQAIATARRLGAVVTAFDVRSAVKEQIESLGARFFEVEGVGDAEAAGGYARELTPEEQEIQRKALAVQMGKSDVIVTTALVPGPPGPEADLRRRRGRHEAGLGDRRPGRRGGRQLRARAAGGDVRDRQRRDDRDAAERAVEHGRARLAALRAQRARAARADERRGGRAEPGLRRRGDRRRVHHARRRDRARAGEREVAG